MRFEGLKEEAWNKPLYGDIIKPYVRVLVEMGFDF
jgi:hypothetical protein